MHCPIHKQPYEIGGSGRKFLPEQKQPKDLNITDCVKCLTWRIAQQLQKKTIIATPRIEVTEAFVEVGEAPVPPRIVGTSHLLPPSTKPQDGSKTKVEAAASKIPRLKLSAARQAKTEAWKVARGAQNRDRQLI
jgi:hypothetical protein